MPRKFPCSIKAVHKALLDCGGNQRKAASLLGVDEGNLSRFKRGPGKAAWIGVPDPSKIRDQHLLEQYHRLTLRPISRQKLADHLDIKLVTLKNLAKRHGLKLPEIFVAPKHRGLTAQQVAEALQIYNGSRTTAAKHLQVSRATLYRFLAESELLGILRKK